MNAHFLSRASAFCAALILAIVAVGCEDAPPNDYRPQYVVQSYLIVDEPIHGLMLTQSQPVTDTFNVRKGIVSDADVRIIDGERTMQLVYKPSTDGAGEYYFPDTTVLVKPGTLYKLEIAMKDGGAITAQAITPQRFAWVKPPVDYAVIPKKTSPAYMHPPDSLDLAWTGTAGVAEYLISVRSLDTLEYGRYLVPETSVKNRRVDADLDKTFDELHYNDLSRWGFLASTSTPIVWGAFKWFGRTEVTLYASDENFVRWFKMTNWTGNPQFDPMLANVRGDGIGVFGTASKITKTMFILMNDR